MAYTEFSASTIIGWCDKTLKHIDEKRKEKIGERVLYYMKPTTFLGFKISDGLSQDDAYKLVMESAKSDESNKSIYDGVSDYCAREYADSQYRKIEDIKKLCQQSFKQGLVDRMIKMSDDDLSNLITD